MYPSSSFYEDSGFKSIISQGYRSFSLCFKHPALLTSVHFSLFSKSLASTALSISCTMLGLISLQLCINLSCVFSLLSSVSFVMQCHTYVSYFHPLQLFVFNLIILNQMFLQNSSEPSHHEVHVVEIGPFAHGKSGKLLLSLFETLCNACAKKCWLVGMVLSLLKFCSVIQVLLLVCCKTQCRN